MNENQLFQALGQVDDSYIPQVQPAAKAGRPRRIVWIAACVAILTALCGSAIAISNVSLTFLGSTSQTWEDGTIEIGYQIEAVLAKMPMSELKGDVREVKGIILQQIRAYKPWMSSMPTCWRGKYDTSQEMLEYLGCKHIRFPEFGWQEEESCLYVYADALGAFQDVRAEVYSTWGGYRIFTGAHIYMELESDRVSLSAFDKYRDSYTQQTYVTEDGRTAVIVCAWDDTDLSYVDGYVVVGNVLYDIHLIGGGHTEQTHEDAVELVKQWLNSF